MDRTVPLAAARLLDLIRDTEVGTDGPSGYNVIFGHNQDKLPEPLTRMTVDEVTGAQASWTKRFGSSAAGGYQFMRATLTGLKSELGLRGSQILDPDLQDRLGYHLLIRRGYPAFMAGEIDRTEFGKRLAQEWASFPVLSGVKGAHRQLARGQSYYAGDALNKSLIKPEEVEAVLDEMKELGDTLPQTAAVAVAKPENAVAPAIGAPALGLPAVIGSVSKAVGAAKGASKGSAVTPALIFLGAKTGWFPPWLFEPEATAAITLIGGILIAGAWAAVSTYRAPPNTSA